LFLLTVQRFLKPLLTTTRALQLFQVLRQGAVILTSILLAKSGLTTGDIGVYETLLYIGTVLTFFWVSGLLQAMTPVFSKLEQPDRKAFIFNNFLVFCAISLLLFGVLLTGERLVVPLLTGLPVVPFFHIFCLYLLFNLPTFPVEYIYLLHQKPVHIVGWGMASFGLQVAVIMLPFWAGYGLQESITGLAALAVLKWIWTAFTVWRYGAWQWRPDIVRKYLVFAWPLIVNVLVGNLIMMFDNWLVGWHYQDTAVFAVFRYGARELPLAQALATALGVAMIPRLTHDLNDGLAVMKSMTRKLFHFLFPVTIVLLLLSKPLFPLVFNPAFTDSAPIFNIFLLITASRLLLPNSIVLSLGRPQVILSVGLAELVMKIVLGFAFIHFWGLQGVAWSAVLAYWVEKAGLIWYLQRKEGIAVSTWVDIRWYLIYGLMMILSYLVSWLWVG
jgi:O-antigen/teichoic acid export membrane protein